MILGQLRMGAHQAINAPLCVCVCVKIFFIQSLYCCVWLTFSGVIEVKVAAKEQSSPLEKPKWSNNSEGVIETN